MDHRFRIDIHQFISTVANYSQNIAIGLPWQGLDSTLHEIESSLDGKSYERALVLARSFKHLHHLHDQAVDEMTGLLFLNKGQQLEVKTLMDELFGIVLRFAALVRENESDDETTRRIHADFRKGVGKFVRYLKAQSRGSASGLGVNRRTAAEPFEQLLLQLDMFGHWSTDR